MNRKIMAEKLKELRGDKSQAEVAEALGISASAYAMYETGKRVPRDDLKVAIAKYFNTTVSYIFYNC